MSQTPDNQQWVERCRKAIPLGSSTNTKAPRHLPEEPGVIVRGDRCRVWDADGREFIDFRNALGPITLGYRYPAIDDAVRRQLDSGILFGQPHPLECEVAEMLCDVIPCAEMARFLKTGGEAIAACIRLARHYTGRDHVVQIGYNGWLNTLAARGQVLPGQSAENVPAGVPPALAALHHAAKWDDIDALEKLFARLDGQVAALVIASSYDSMERGADFYPAVRALTRRHGALLIFDEIVTGFRIAVGGAQEYFNVAPDLAVFAKGMANGMPISTYLGRREVMGGLSRAVVSSTYGGETLSLAAAKAAIETYRARGVVEHLWRQGKTLATGANRLFEAHGLPVRLSGMSPLSLIAFSPDAPNGFADRFFRAAYRNGLSLFRVAYINFSHADADIAEALDRLDAACTELAKEI